MKRNILLLLMVIGFPLFISGCDSDSDVITVNMNAESDVVTKEAGAGSLICIGGTLYYDPITYIVYFWNGDGRYSYYTTMPSPYYASNGLPYKYNVETNSFEEIVEEVK